MYKTQLYILIFCSFSPANVTLHNGIVTIAENTVSYYKDVRDFITGQFYASRIKRRPEHFKGHTGVTRLSYGTHCGTFLGVPMSRTNQ